MKKIYLGLLTFVLFCSHTMFLKLDSYFLEPNTAVQIKLFNGTFELSENVIDRDRMLDVSLLGNGTRIKMDDSQWSEKDNVTLLNFQTGEAGTWVAGVSTAPRSIEMDAEAFNTYLEHEGILDMVAWRNENKAQAEAAVEKYSKHVKTIFQVGEKRSDDWGRALGYPIEFVPLENPYNLHTGENLKFKLLFNGEPLANQLVYADYKPAKGGHSHDSKTEHSHDENGDHTHTSGQQLRTDSNGIATTELTADGIWYLQTINLVNSDEENFTHESNWATLTFEVTHGHGDDTHTHDEAEGIPSYAYWIGSLLVVGILFFWFNKKN